MLMSLQLWWRVLEICNADALPGALLNQAYPATHPRAPGSHFPGFLPVGDHANPRLLDYQSAVNRGWLHLRLTAPPSQHGAVPRLTSLSRWKIVAQASCA